MSTTEKTMSLRTPAELNTALTKLLASDKKIECDEDGTIREKQGTVSPLCGVLFTREELNTIDQRLCPLINYLSSNYRDTKIKEILKLTWPYYQNKNTTIVNLHKNDTYDQAIMLEANEITFDANDKGLVYLHIKGVGVFETSNNQWYIPDNSLGTCKNLDAIMSKVWLEEHYPGAIERIHVGLAMDYNQKKLATCLQGTYHVTNSADTLPEIDMKY